VDLVLISLCSSAMPMVLSRCAVLAALAITCEAGPLADKWIGFVSAGESKRSVWSNQAQVDEEAKQPQLPEDKRHPFVRQTRFYMDDHIANKETDERFVAIEIGQQADCLPGCSVVLFGLSDKDSDNVMLRSYKSPKLSSAVQVLQKDPEHSGAVIDFKDIDFHGFSVTYRWFPSNSSFYGVGGGNLDDGNRLDVFETVAKDLVAPLELFYGPDGTLETTYDTPVRYHQETTESESVIV